MRARWVTIAATTALAWSVAHAAQPSKRPSDAERGRELWDRHCVACHGPGNRGDGPATEALVFPVPDLRGKTKVDDDAIKVVLRGRGGMPGFENTFDKADARRVLNTMAHIHKAASTQPKAPEPTEPEPSDDADAGDVPDE